VVVCGIAMQRSAIDEDNVIDCAVIERNVFVSSVALQNPGYAYMPIA
jgi:intracellular sulfur oxidation DsrE/DsrF family protein